MELESLFLNLRSKTTAENLNLILSNNEFQNSSMGLNQKRLSVFCEVSQLF